MTRCPVCEAVNVHIEATSQEQAMLLAKHGKLSIWCIACNRAWKLPQEEQEEWAAK